MESNGADACEERVANKVAGVIEKGSGIEGHQRDLINDSRIANEEANLYTTVLHFPNKVQCHIVGVCHLSQASARAARRTVEVLRPDIVCLELCEERMSLLEAEDPKQSKELPPLSCATVREHWQVFLDPVFWVVHLQLMALEALVGAKLGAEQAEAASAAQSVQSQVFLADRRQSVTMARTIAALASFTAIRDLVVALRSGAAELSGIAMEVVELEKVLLSSDLSDGDFCRAGMLARRIVDMLLNSPPSVNFGRGGEPIQEERDYLLSHALHHSCCIAPPGGKVVAILGAAHTPGVIKHFETFRQRGCSAGQCAVEQEVLALNEVNYTPIYTLVGALLLTSCAGFAGRVLFVRHLRRTRGDRAARSFNIATGAVACGFGVFALFRAQRQYGAVRRLQLHRHGLSK